MKLTILHSSGDTWIRWFTLDRFVKWHNEKFILRVLRESGYGACGRTSAIQHRQHFVRIINWIHLPRINVETLNIFAINYLKKKRREMIVKTFSLMEMAEIKIIKKKVQIARNRLKNCNANYRPVFSLHLLVCAISRFEFENNKIVIGIAITTNETK